jgi:hypothetical protein
MEWGNWALILIGFGLIAGGPWIVYRTIETIRKIR